MRGGSRPGAGRKPTGAAEITAHKGDKATVKSTRLLSQLAIEHAEMAMQTLVSVASNKSNTPASRVTAAAHILDRAYGKPGQVHEHTGANGGPIAIADLRHLTDDQLAAIEPLLSALAAAGAPAGASTH